MTYYCGDAWQGPKHAEKVPRDNTNYIKQPNTIGPSHHFLQLATIQGSCFRELKNTHTLPALIHWALFVETALYTERYDCLLTALRIAAIGRRDEIRPLSDAFVVIRVCCLKGYWRLSVACARSLSASWT